MAWPLGLPRGSVNFGAAVVAQSGQPLAMRVTIDVILASDAASKVLVFRPTGQPLVGITTVFDSDDSTDTHTMELPLCDTTSMGYGNGFVISLDQTHRFTHVYRATIDYLSEDRKTTYTALRTVKSFVLTSDAPTGDIDDLVLIPDSVEQFGLPVSIPNSWGANIDAAAESAADAAASAFEARQSADYTAAQVDDAEAFAVEKANAAVTAQDIPGKINIAVASQDIPGKVRDEVAAQPTVTIAASQAAIAAVSGALDTAGVLHSAYPIDVAATGYLWMLHDAANNILFGITGEGKIEAILGDTSQVPYWTALVGNPMAKFNADVYGYMYAITDAADNVLFGIRNDGSVELPGVSIGVADGSITVAKMGSDVLARLPVSGLNYDKARIGRNLVAPAPSGGTRAFTALADGVCWGDSMTDGWPTSDFTDRATMAYPAVLDSLLPGAVVHNGGSTGQSADEIALRQGGLVLMLNISGGSIPASGGVVVVETSTLGWRLDRGFNENRDLSGVAGTLAGVPGRLTRSSSTVTFTRTTAGSAVAVTGPQQFISTEGETYKECWQILFAGRNNIGYTSPAGDQHDQTVNAYVAMVEKARISVARPRILIAGVLPATGETSGSANHNLVKQINATLEALYPPGSNIAYAREGAVSTGRDFRSYLTNQVIYDLGITPTTNDLNRIAGDTLPYSIMAVNGTDSVHYSVACAAKVAAWWKNRLVEKGWATA